MELTTQARRAGASYARRYRPTARLLAEVQGRALARNCAEYAETMRLARSATTAVDVGAYVGNFALGMAKSVGSAGTVLALEPQSGVFPELCRSTAGTCVVPVNAAASDQAGSAVLTVPFDSHRVPARQRATVHPTVDDGALRETVTLVRLDDLLQDRRSPVSVMKIDVDGHERHVLRGALGIISEDHPAMVIEVEQRCLGQSATVADVIGSVTEMGYECRCIGRTNQVFPWSDFDLEADQLRWLTSDGDVPPVDVARYVNNFVLTWGR